MYFICVNMFHYRFCCYGWLAYPSMGIPSFLIKTIIWTSLLNFILRHSCLWSDISVHIGLLISSFNTIASQPCYTYLKYDINTVCDWNKSTHTTSMTSMLYAIETQLTAICQNYSRHKVKLTGIYYLLGLKTPMTSLIDVN